MRKKNLDTHHIYYCYGLFDWCGVPRYIGKGKEGSKREEGHEKQTDLINIAKNEFIEQTWIMLGEIPKTIIRDNLTEAEAFATEIALIKAIGRLCLGTGPLTNMTEGGEGAAGLTWSKESRDRKRLTQTERMASLERREQIRLKLLGRKPSKEEVQRMVLARHHSGIIQKPFSRKARENLGNNMRGKTHSTETKIKMGNSRRGKTHTTETKTKMSVSASLVQGPRRRKEMLENPKAIEHMTNMSHKRTSDPEDSSKRSDIAKNLWANPIYRERVLLARKLAKEAKKIQQQLVSTHIDNSEVDRAR